MKSHPTISREERNYYQNGYERTPAWLCYRLAHRMVRQAMRDVNRKQTDVDECRSYGKLQLRLFVLRFGDVAIGYCYGALAPAMRATFQAIGVLIHVTHPAAWEKLQASFVKQRRAQQRKAVVKKTWGK